MSEKIEWHEAPDGMYVVKNGVTYKVEPRMAKCFPLAKKYNLATGEVTYPANADKVRNMNADELAHLLGWPVYVSPPWCDEHDICPYMDEDPAPCDKCALEWLKRPAE